MKKMHWGYILFSDDQTVPTQHIPPDGIEGATRSESTQRKTKHDMELMKDYLKTVGENREMEAIPLNELDVHFGKFLLSVRKQDGSLYGASSMMAFVASFNRYLRDKKGYPYQVTRGIEFKYSQSALNRKLTELKTLGLGVRKASEDNKLNFSDVENLFQIGEIGLHNPKAVMKFLYVSIMCGLGIKHCAEMYRLKWGDIVFCVKDDGMEFLTHVKDVKPIMDSETSDMIVMSGTKPKIFGNTNKARCPIEAYKLYACKRPVSMNDPHSPFFLSVVAKHSEVGQAWYSNQGMGKNSAGSLLKELIRKSRQVMEKQWKGSLR